MCWQFVLLLAYYVYELLAQLMLYVVGPRAAARLRADIARRRVLAGTELRKLNPPTLPFASLSDLCPS